MKKLLLIPFCLALALLIVLAACTVRVDYGTETCVPVEQEPHSGSRDVTFIAFGDPQFGGGAPDKNALAVRAMNVVEDTLRWDPAYFGIDAPVSGIRGVIIAGDITQNGRDGRFTENDEYQRFVAHYGLCGNRELKYPVYEGYGNHDYYVWNNPMYRLFLRHPVVDSVSRRNRYRPGVVHTAPGRDGHYSWQWDDVHLVQTNLKPSDVAQPLSGDYGPVRGAGDPRNALTFLKKDLALHAADNNTPVIVISHYGFFSGWDFERWWTPEEAEAYAAAIEEYNVIAHLHGHAHNTSTYTWNGLPVLNVGSPYYQQYNEDGRGRFTLIRITDDALYAGDVSWNPEDPEGDLIFPHRWHRVIPLS